MQQSLTLRPLFLDFLTHSIRGDGWDSYWRRANRSSQLAKSGRSIDPRVAIWRDWNFAAVPFPRSPGADADQRSSVYAASLSARAEEILALCGIDPGCSSQVANIINTYSDDNSVLSP